MGIIYKKKWNQKGNGNDEMKFKPLPIENA